MTTALTERVSSNMLKVYQPEALEKIVDQELSTIFADEEELLNQSKRVQVTNTDEMGRAGDLVKMIKVRTDNAEELRLLVTRPPNQFVKNVNKKIKDRSLALDTAMGYVLGKIDARRRLIEQQRAEEQARLQREANEKAAREAQEAEERASQAREAEAALNATGDREGAQIAAESAREAETEAVAIREAGTIPVADTTVRGVRGTYGASVGGRKTWEAKIVDLRAMTNESIALVMANDDAKNAIRKALRPLIEPRLAELRSGRSTNPIPGVEFEQVSTTQVR